MQPAIPQIYIISKGSRRVRQANGVYVDQPVLDDLGVAPSREKLRELERHVGRLCGSRLDLRIPLPQGALVPGREVVARFHAEHPGWRDYPREVVADMLQAMIETCIAKPRPRLSLARTG